MVITVDRANAVRLKDSKIVDGRGMRDVPEGTGRVEGGMKPDRGVLPPIENRIPPPPSKKESK
jgi:hypothetical protein